jgi:hypothetical protein
MSAQGYYNNGPAPQYPQQSYGPPQGQMNYGPPQGYQQVLRSSNSVSIFL